MQFHLLAPMFLFVFMFILHAPISLSAVEDRYLNCKKSYNCSGISISYPFWGQVGPEYCGHSGFELDNCEAEAPVISISQSIYRVLGINTGAKALTVARNDYWNDYCPTALVNSTIDFSLFNYVNSTNITLYYDCPPYTLPGSPNQINCNINGTTMIGYYATQNLTDTWAPLKKLLDSCTYAVFVPLYQSAANSIVENSTTSLTDALNAGFGLTYAANDSLCEGCVQSNGYCGQNETSSKFVCYCPDGAHLSKCGEGLGEKSGEQQQKRRKKSSTSLVIGLVIAAVAIVAVSAGLILFSIRRRSKQVVSQTMYKDIASFPSSKSFPSPSSKSYPTTTATSYYRSTPSYTTSKSDLETASAYFGVRLFSMAEMEEATYNFHSSREIGDGGFGVVYYGKLRDGCEVAIKRLYQKSFKHVEQFMNEVEIVARLRHPNLVTLYGCTSRHSRDLLLVYEYIPNGTVSSHLHGNGSNCTLLTWPTRLSIAIETADALAYLHSLDVIHRDVKTNNILLDNDFHTKVADFGLSRLFPTDVTHVSTAPQGTPGYVDPEYYKTYQLTTKSDVYSFGVVLIELISSQEAVDTKRHQEDINLSTMAISKIQDGSVHELVDPGLGFERDANIKRMITLVAGLALRCLQQERATRPTMQEVLQELKRIKNEGFSAERTNAVDAASDGLGF